MILDNLLGLASDAEGDAEAYEVAAREAVRTLVAPTGKVEPKLLEREQFAAHGFAWIATYVAALRQMRRWADGGARSGNGGELELLMLQSAFGEYLAQLSGGIAISQVEIVRPADLGSDAAALDTLAVRKLIAANTSAVRLRIAELIADGIDSGNFGALELGDEALDEVRRQFRRFVEAEVAPHAHGWHLRDELIPAEPVDRGDGRAWRVRSDGARALGRARAWARWPCAWSPRRCRAAISAWDRWAPVQRSPLNSCCAGMGPTTQKEKFPVPASTAGAILPTAVFTEPEAGSDLASHCAARAVRDGDVWQVIQAQQDLDHPRRPGRPDDPAGRAADAIRSPDHRGLSMFLAEKPRGTDAEPFPAPRE